MTIDKVSMTPFSTIRSDEVVRFNRLAATWWNRTGPMRPLHVVNELRLGYVLEQIAQRFGRPVGALQGLRIADVGCGAGLMCEPLTARGSRMSTCRHGFTPRSRPAAAAASVVRGE